MKNKNGVMFILFIFIAVLLIYYTNLYLIEKGWGKLLIPREISFSPDDKHLAVRFMDGLRLWNLENDKSYYFFYPLRFDFSPDGKWLALGRDGIAIFNILDEKLFYIDKGKDADFMGFSPDGKLLAFGRVDKLKDSGKANKDRTINFIKLNRIDTSNSHFEQVGPRSYRCRKSNNLEIEKINIPDEVSNISFLKRSISGKWIMLFYKPDKNKYYSIKLTDAKIINLSDGFEFECDEYIDLTGGGKAILNMWGPGKIGDRVFSASLTDFSVNPIMQKHDITDGYKTAFVDISHNGEYIVFRNSTDNEKHNEMIVFDTNSRMKAQRISISEGISHFAVSSSGKILATGHNRNERLLKSGWVDIYNVDTGRKIKTLVPSFQEFK